MPKSVKYPNELISISDHLRKRRLDLKLSQIAVARIIGVSEDTITYWENERTVPQMSLMPKIIRFLGYNPISIDTSTLGGKIKEFRYLRGLSKKRMADRLNVDPSTITTWEDNLFMPSVRNYERIMCVLELLDRSLKTTWGDVLE
jgi:DNA-binding XRE family transcriptional regulator